jgi:predicted patatin/cPLA2 family phospholipase
MYHLNKKTAVIFEGGGMRGLYTAGVTDALMADNFLPDAIYGVSAGACHAISYLSNQQGRARRVNINYCTRSDYCGPLCLIREHSVFGWKLMFHRIPEELDPVDYDMFFENCNSSLTSRIFTLVVTDALTGKSAYLTPETPEEVLRFAQASSSLPFVCPPVQINEVPCFDGGISDSIPAQKAIDDGSTKLLVVLTQAEGYRKQPQKHAELIRKFYRKYPAVAEAIINRPEMYNAQLDLVRTLEIEKKAVVLRPGSDINVGRMERDPVKLQKLYEAGFAAGKRGLAEFRKLPD